MTIMGHVDVHRCYAEEIGAIRKSLQFFYKTGSSPLKPEVISSFMYASSSTNQ